MSAGSIFQLYATFSQSSNWFPPICGPPGREPGFVIPQGPGGRPLHPEQCHFLVRSIFAMDRTIGLTDGVASKSVLGPPGRADTFRRFVPRNGSRVLPRRAKRSPAPSPSSLSIVTLWLDVRRPPSKKWRSDRLSDPAFTPGQPGPP